MNLLDRRVLVLNKSWQAVGQVPCSTAISMCYAGAALPLNFVSDEEYYPVTWDAWLGLEVREDDDAIHSPKLTIRAPTVVISSTYNKMPRRTPKLNRVGVARRDKHRCQYCGRLFPLSELNLDHVYPQMLGGKTTWDNIVASCIPCNTAKGHKTTKEFGKAPLKQPVKPLEVPISATLDSDHPHHQPFLHK